MERDLFREKVLRDMLDYETDYHENLGLILSVFNDKLNDILGHDYPEIDDAEESIEELDDDGIY